MKQIAARKTILVVLSLEETKAFVQTHHKQGMAQMGKSPSVLA